jgi:hypothetical protein
MSRAPLPLAQATGAAVALAGAAFVGVGLWGRREVARALARERIVAPGTGEDAGTPVRDAAAARSLAEVIRGHTLAAAGGRTYSETDPFLDRDGNPTADRAAALIDERTGQPVANPQYALWIQSTTLQTALMQAYASARLAELTMALGGSLVLAGAGVAAAGAARARASQPTP